MKKLMFSLIPILMAFSLNAQTYSYGNQNSYRSTTPSYYGPTTQAQKQSTPSGIKSNPRYYTNSKGQRVQSPTYYSTPPKGATAKCRNGNYSFSKSRRGTCSSHGGVAKWL